MQTYEEQKAVVAKLNVIDDILFQKMAEDQDVAEEILRIILEKPALKVIQSQTQRFLRNVGAHSVILDLLCEDEDHSLINCEVQKEDDDDHQRRVRFNHSNIDTVFVEKGIDYRDLPDVYLIFISKFDTFGEDRTIYHINRIIEETGSVVDNGVHEIYVNTAVNDNSDIAELMQYFKNSVGEHQNFMKLCNRVRYFKEDQKGVQIMCQAVQEYAVNYAREYAEKYAKEYAEKYAKEYAAEATQRESIQTAINFLKNGASVDLIAQSIPSLSRQFIVELSKQLQQPV